MSKERCPYIQKCKQQIPKEELDVCLGQITYPNWNYEDCLKFRDLGNEIVRKTPKEWLLLTGGK